MRVVTTGWKRLLWCAWSLPLLVLGGCGGGETSLVGLDLTEEDSALNDRIRLPPGFVIHIYAENLPLARSLALGDSGTVFVGSFSSSPGARTPVYALSDTDGDGRADRTFTYREPFNTPNGIAFRDGALFVADVDKVYRFDAIESDLTNLPAPQLIHDGLPTREEADLGSRFGHYWRYAALGPDGMLYVAVGTRYSDDVGTHTAQDLVDDERYSSIVRMQPDGSGFEVFADGVRNSVGMDFHPQTGDLWFTENGASWPFSHSDFYDIPPDELNHAPAAGMHFGFPYVHGGIPDPLIGVDSPTGLASPAYEFLAHSAPLGMRFYTGMAFPNAYRNAIFVAEHGTLSFTPTPDDKLHGDRVSVIRLAPDGGVHDYKVFADGFRLGSNMDYDKRPVDLLVMPDGALLVSDDQAGMVYRIVFEGQ